MFILHKICLAINNFVYFQLDRKLVAIPRSTNKDRINQNIDLMDFSLTSQEVEELSSFNSNYRLRTPAKWYPHPFFPFEKKNLTDDEIRHIITNSKEDWDKRKISDFHISMITILRLKIKFWSVIIGSRISIKRSYTLRGLILES